LLPLDLQTQLAKTLYDIRYSLNSSLLNSHELLGQKIDNQSFCSSSRFRQFTQNHELVGQISAALIRHGDESAKGFIRPETLERIIKDLHEVQVAREWLRKAREHSKQFEIRGVEKTKKLSSDRMSTHRRNESRMLGIQPQIILRSMKNNSWTVMLEIPDFSNLARAFPELQRALLELRCTVPCSSNRPLARGQLLCGTQHMTLKRWPASDEILLSFEEKLPELEFYTKSEYLLGPDPTRLFRIANDNNGYEIKSKTIRPGNKYIIVYENDYSLDEVPFTSKTVIICEGITGLLLDLPPVLSTSEIDQLRKYGLNPLTNVKIWPVGLPPPIWDGEGYSEWLSNETPCIAVQAEHPAHKIKMELDSGDSIVFRKIEPGYPLFVKLPKMEVGHHTLKITITPFEEAQEETYGVMEFIIREQRSWIPGICHSNIFIVMISPTTPTLEELWGNKVSINIHGPAGRRIYPIISFFNKYDDLLLERNNLPSIKIPFNEAAWKSYFDVNIRRKKDIQNIYDLTKFCTINFVGGEIGNHVLKAERDFTPLAWKITFVNKSSLLQLLDNTGLKNDIVVKYYDFSTPDAYRVISYEEAAKGFNDLQSGGLLLAEIDSSTVHCRQAIIAPSTHKITSFQDLTVNPQISNLNRSINDILGLLSLLDVWANARHGGDCSSIIKQRRVMEVLHAEIIGLICGRQWQDAEISFRREKSDDALLQLKRATYSSTLYKGLASVLFRDCTTFVNKSTAERVEWLFSEFKKFSLNTTFWHCELALRLASSPETLHLWASNKLLDGISNLMEQRTIARAARFFVLSLERCSSLAPIDPIPMYANWDWSSGCKK
jgi:hypothetical protein